jgi:hypothetical protein
MLSDPCMASVWIEQTPPSIHNGRDHGQITARVQHGDIHRPHRVDTILLSHQIPGTLQSIRQGSYQGFVFLAIKQKGPRIDGHVVQEVFGMPQAAQFSSIVFPEHAARFLHIAQSKGRGKSHGRFVHPRPGQSLDDQLSRSRSTLSQFLFQFLFTCLFLLVFQLLQMFLPDLFFYLFPLCLLALLLSHPLVTQVFLQ